MMVGSRLALLRLVILAYDDVLFPQLLQSPLDVVDKQLDARNLVGDGIGLLAAGILFEVDGENAGIERKIEILNL